MSVAHGSPSHPSVRAVGLPAFSRMLLGTRSTGWSQTASVSAKSSTRWPCAYLQDRRSAIECTGVVEAVARLARKVRAYALYRAANGTLAAVSGGRSASFSVPAAVRSEAPVRNRTLGNSLFSYRRRQHELHR